MAEGLNRVMLLGNLGEDPKFFAGQRDGGVLRLRMACNESWFDKQSNERKERTEWVNVVIFGKRAEALEKILQKGSSIFVEGRLQTSSYEKDGEKRYSTDVVATNVILAGGKGQGASDDRRGDDRRGGDNRSRGGSWNDRDGARSRGGGGNGGSSGRRDPNDGYPDDGGYDDDIPF